MQSVSRNKDDCGYPVFNFAMFNQLFMLNCNIELFLILAVPTLKAVEIVKVKGLFCFLLPSARETKSEKRGCSSGLNSIQHDTTTDMHFHLFNDPSGLVGYLFPNLQITRTPSGQQKYQSE